MSSQPRTATVTRGTSESRVEVTVDLDGTGAGDVSTGVRFYDHMLLSLAKHSLIDLTVRADGDVDVDAHHTVEDVAIVLGQAVREALGDKSGISRFGDATVPPRLAPAFGLFRIEDTAVLTARAAGVRAVTRWALRSADGELVASRQLPRLTPESVHRVLGTAAHAREVPVRAVRELWERVDLGHEEWLVEAATVLGLPGARVLAGTDTELGPVVRPAPRSVPAFESVIKDVHQ